MGTSNGYIYIIYMTERYEFIIEHEFIRQSLTEKILYSFFRSQQDEVIISIKHMGNNLIAYMTNFK